jgi:hypothetical protein
MSRYVPCSVSYKHGCYIFTVLWHKAILSHCCRLCTSWSFWMFVSEWQYSWMALYWYTVWSLLMKAFTHVSGFLETQIKCHRPTLQSWALHVSCTFFYINFITLHAPLLCSNTTCIEVNFYMLSSTIYSFGSLSVLSFLHTELCLIKCCLRILWSFCKILY